MTETTWRFEALDTWFFRESRPHGLVGGSELESLFPPPARTVAGALRTLLGEQAGIDWTVFKQGDGKAHRIEGLDLIAAIGHGDDLGPLRLRGPWLTHPERGDERLYPAPGFLMTQAQGEDRKYMRLRIGAPVRCDLGMVHLPVLDQRGAKPLEGAWLTAAGYAQALAGGIAGADDIVIADKLYDSEPRLGIARDNRRRTIEEGLLYQTRHIRPKNGVAVEMDVAGLDPRLHPQQDRIRLGGEGRLALVTIQDATATLPAAPTPGTDTKGLVLCLLTHADLDGSWLPPGFTRDNSGGVTVWRGEINGVPLTCRSAVLGRAVREGGWDLLNHRPRPVRSLIPAGSAWYCSVDEGNLETAIAALHGAQIGRETELGRGLIAAGLWTEHEYPAKENTQ